MGGTALGASGRSNNGLKLDVKTGKLSLWRLFPTFTFTFLLLAYICRLLLGAGRRAARSSCSEVAAAREELHLLPVPDAGLLAPGCLGQLLLPASLRSEVTVFQYAVTTPGPGNGSCTVGDTDGSACGLTFVSGPAAALLTGATFHLVTISPPTGGTFEARLYQLESGAHVPASGAQPLATSPSISLQFNPVAATDAFYRTDATVHRAVAT